MNAAAVDTAELSKASTEEKGEIKESMDDREPKKEKVIDVNQCGFSSNGS